MKILICLVGLVCCLGWAQGTPPAPPPHGGSNPPNCTGANEEYSKCNAHCQKTCETRDKELACTKQCQPGCVCKTGYTRDGTGNCIPENECKCCPKNEMYVNCEIGYCQPKKCDDLGYPVPCPGIVGPCEGGCVCQNGYVRDCAGICIPKDQCPSCGGDENAVTGCSNHCGNSCNDYKTPHPCPLLCKVNGCNCRKGYVFDETLKKCVLPENCSTKPICTGENETPTDRENMCPPQTCESIYTTYHCLPKEPKPGCKCINGYLRDKDGKCIPSDQCQSNEPKCKGDNEEYSKCYAHCQKTCETRDKEIACTKQCQPGCVCKTGYIRDGTGNCISENECKCCPKNEMYVNCEKGYCQPKKCDDLGYPIPCPGIVGPCAGDCVCKNGYVRDCAGICIPKEQCPSCGGDENAVTGCSNYCGNSCNDYKTTLACPLFCMYNGCNCRKGYVYDKTIKKCVLPKNCPNKCGPNEHYEDCPKQTKGEKGSKPCKPACVCDAGYVRKDKKCVPKCGMNEHYTQCSNPCPVIKGMQCKVRCIPGCICDEGYERKGKKCVQKIVCSKHEHYSPCINPCPKGAQCVAPCIAGCLCDKGYVRKDNKCVKKEVPRCTGNHEIFSKCYAHCQKTCQNKDKPLVCTKQCKPGCICEPGYVRNDEGKCVAENKCLPRCTGAHEIFSKCYAHCQKTCQNKDKPLVCTKQCKPGCICEPGYVRNDEGKCVAENKCLPRCTGAHEIFSKCYAHCQKTCQNKDKPLVCTKQCKPGCICEPGYVRNDEGKCVAENKCYPQCKEPHEVFSRCNGHCQKTCKNKDKPLVCTKQCKPGCICEPGYVRDDEGKCVAENKCTHKCNGVHEKYSQCNAHCQKTCETRDKALVCTKQCQPGCVCETGYVRDGLGQCIAEDDCRYCPRDEKYVNCEKGYCVPKKCEDLNHKIRCPAITKPCKGDCVCKDNYVRNCAGICVPKEKCDHCGANKHYEDCPKGENNSKPCTPGCVCNDGYIKKDNKCINKCGLNEHYTACINPCPKGGKCPVPCISGCICNQGYERKGNRCVKKIVCGKHEHYSPCINPCPKGAQCFASCIPGCLCDEGYIRKDDKCVKEKVPRCTGAHEIFSKCYVNCQKTCQNKDKPLVCTKECKPGCICEPGYVRNDENKCIAENKCRQCRENEHYEDCPKGKECSKTCTPGCVCNDGYVKKDNKCIKKCGLNEHYTECTNPCPLGEKCPVPIPGCICNKGYERKGNRCVKKIVCGKHEHYSPCINPCPKGAQCFAPCIPGCLCDEGYIRKDDKCVKEKVPRCTGAHEIFSKCYVNCQKTCQNKDKPLVCTKECKPGCICEPGYVRNDENKCIAENKCRQCRENEHYEDCPKGKECSKPCTPGCVCNDGYVKKDNKCIKKCGLNEHYTECTNPCPLGEKCPVPIPGCICNKGYERKGNRCVKKIVCGKHEHYSPCINPCPKGAQCFAPCIPGCLCDEGYIRKDDKCVKEKVPRCTGAHEIFSKCYVNCQKTCQNKDKPLVCTKECKPGCICEPGYVRNDENKCIAENKCRQCRENEHYEDCPKGKEVSKPCMPGCVCNDGYIRKDNRCVKKCGLNEHYTECTNPCPLGEKCPVPIPGCICNKGYERKGNRCVKKIVCGKHEHYSPCINPCPKGAQCFAPCIPGCLCDEGYIRKDDKCVKEEVPRCTETHEIFSKCYAHCQKTCQNKDKPLVCTKECKPGCICEPGYVRNDENKCIAENKCCQCRENEHYEDCPKGKKCSKPCTPGCVCNEGYIRKDNKCIKKSCGKTTTTETKEESESHAEESASDSHSQSKRIEVTEEDGTVIDSHNGDSGKKTTTVTKEEESESHAEESASDSQNKSEKTEVTEEDGTVIKSSNSEQSESSSSHNEEAESYRSKTTTTTTEEH